jgi:hypothetical protein
VPIRSKAFRAAPCAAILSLFLAVPAVAQGTSEQRTACMSDAMRLCASSIPDVDRIAACLSRQRPSLSAACRVVMGEPGGTVEVAATGSVRRRVAP